MCLFGVRIGLLSMRRFLVLFVLCDIVHFCWSGVYFFTFLLFTYIECVHLVLGPTLPRSTPAECPDQSPACPGITEDQCVNVIIVA